jgi:GT2 family glycosyltransferase
MPIAEEVSSCTGIVVIGRNEGERLKTCIRSLSATGTHIVYVDSGSTDKSVDFVEQSGFDVVELDMSTPFSAGRARNEGYRYLLAQYPNIQYIQFVDGDCEVREDWLNVAYNHLRVNPGVVAVCGRRKERFPESSIYNQLCDIEWNTPVGLTSATGGDFMCRAQALVDVGGFSPQVIAGEEPELCYRWRQKGWLIERLDAGMTLHDAAMTNVKQWWKRCERAGHAYAQGFSMHGNSDEQYYRKEIIRVACWCLLFLVSITLAIVVSAWALTLLGFYFLKIGHIFLKESSMLGVRPAFFYAVFLVFGKFPEGKGVLVFLVKKIFGRGFKIIEYKK